MLCSDFTCSNCVKKVLSCYPNEAACPICPAPSPPPPPPAPCVVCDKNNKNRPTSLTFLYTAGQGVNQNNQGTRAYGSLTSTFPSSASISMSGFSAQVTDGSTFTISGSFGADSQVSISGQTINFHTSCSVELKTGDRFGPLTVIGSNTCSIVDSCGDYGCCPEGGAKDDWAGSNCCSADKLPECVLCCPDGTPQPCCSKMPEIIEHATDIVVVKDQQCSAGMLPFLMKGAINIWLATNGGARCRLNNEGPDIDSEAMGIWTADTSILDAQTTICNEGGCPDIPVKFTCCDPCSPDMLCVSTYAKVSVSDTNKPQIGGVGSTVIECTGNELNAVHAWVQQASCTDMEGNAQLMQTSVPDLVGPSCARQASVTFACSDDCGNVVTDVATITIKDRTAPIVSVDPTDMTVTCDGNGNLHDVQLWLNFHGGMFVMDACSGGCSNACTGGCSYNTNFGNLIGDNEQASETTCAAVTWMHTEPAFMPCGVDHNGHCQQCAPVTFTATDGCGNSVSRTSTFIIVDDTPPTISVPAQHTISDFKSSNENELAFYEWILNKGGTVFDGGCTDDLSYSMVPPHPMLPNQLCQAQVQVTFIATDRCGRSISSTSTFRLEDNDGPKINPVGLCPEQVLEYTCDKSCPGYSDAVWEAAARTAMTTWATDFACLCATDCSNVVMTITGVPQAALCGETGFVTVTATDEDGMTDTEQVPYRFPIIEAVPPTPPTPPAPPVGCLICNKSNKNRPTSLTFLYTAGQGKNSNNQGTRAYGALTSTFPASASINFNGNSQATVTDGQTFTVSGSFPADSNVVISGTSINFHTSCSVDLKTGDIYGPLTVVGSNNCPAYIQCGSQYGCCPDDPDMPCLTPDCDNCNDCGQFGCCVGTNSPKIDFMGSNCPKVCDVPQICTRPIVTCEDSLYGCCPNSDIPMSDGAGTNCPCASSTFGCCGSSQIKQIDMQGSNCPCWTSTFGCCPMNGVPGAELEAKIDNAGSNCPVPPCEPSPAPGCVICDRQNKNRPTSMTFQYNSGFQFPASASISMDGFSGTVVDGQVFTISGSIGTWTYIDSASFSQVGIHTSCSVSLAAGDIYGPFTILGGSKCPYVPCTAPVLSPISAPGVSPTPPPYVAPAVTPSPTKQIVCLACGSIVLHSCSVSSASCVNYGSDCPNPTGCNGADRDEDAPGGGNGGSSFTPAGNVANTGGGPGGCSFGAEACTVKKEKLLAITFEYTGKKPLLGNFKKPNALWNHAQSEYKKINVKGNLKDSSKHPFKIGGARKYNIQDQLYNGKFVTMHNDGTGTIFTLDARDSNKKALPAALKMKIRGLQVIFSAGSCREQVRIGDEFGPLRVIGFETSKRDVCAWNPANPNRVSLLTGNALESSDDGATTTSTATIALGAVGAIVVVLAAIGAIVYVRRGDQQTALQPGAFEVDLDSRQIRRIDSNKDVDNASE